MRNLFLTFLLVLMPLQFAQAAMCAYCCNEQAPSSMQGNSSHGTAVDAEQLDDTRDSGSSHHSCSTCHLTCAKFYVSQPGVFQPLKITVSFHQETIDYQSYIPRGLDRPNWTKFA